MLDDLVQISPQPLPDRELFFKAWITFLKNLDDSAADAWLREAVRLFEGTVGFEQLALSRGQAYPRTYLVGSLPSKRKLLGSNWVPALTPSVASELLNPRSY
jgi:hypothetical protein